MHIDYSNVNTLWASILVETLVRLGLKTVVISPGSRSTPLTVAFAQQRKITKIPVLDERSAAFLALGIAKRTHQPTVLVCTSGTAGANFYPAVIEAQPTHVPLIIMTADRPPELRNCRAGQTIDQVKLYGNYPNWQTELATPSPEIAMLSYLRQTIIQAWERALLPLPGVVHINLPFREPLAPIREIGIEKVKANLDLNKFFAHIRSVDEYSMRNNFIAPSVLEIWQKSRQGLIIAGLAQPQARYSYCQAIAHLSEIFAFPVIAEALSPLRNYSEVNPRVITSYDLILSNEELAQELVPEIIIQIGELPTSKTLRTWLANLSCPRYILDNNYENLDPLHGNSISLNCSWESLKQINLESNN
ncbi:MAG: 2-succinyl-5-enolpyruvyl-6-hydroxy-3-cyclohexene-1-carboxylic-acid synthase, partial [Cyanobacteria bacterium J083]